MYCVKCGMQIPEGAAFCPNCGEAVNTQQATQAAQTQTPYVVNEDQEELARKKEQEYLLAYSEKVKKRGVISLVFSLLFWGVFILIFTVMLIQLARNGFVDSYYSYSLSGLDNLLMVLLIIAGFFQIPAFIISIVGMCSAKRFRRRYGEWNKSAHTGLRCSIIANVIVTLPVLIFAVYCIYNI